MCMCMCVCVCVCVCVHVLQDCISFHTCSSQRDIMQHFEKETKKDRRGERKGEEGEGGGVN